MRFKKYFLVICLIICLFTIASACASEVNDTEISAIDSDDNLEINEDNQVMDNDNGGLSGNASAKDDNVGIPAQQRDENSDSDRLGITDGDLIGDELNAKVVALNVTVADKPMFVVDCADKFNGNVAIRIGENKSIYDSSAKALIEADRLPAGNYVATALFYGDSNYENLTHNNIMFTVSRLTPTIDVNIEDVTYPNTAYANVHVGNYANGTVNVTVNKRTFKGVMSNGEANVALYGLPGGRMNAQIQFFSSDDYNNNVSSDDEFVVIPNNSLITIRCNEISYVGEDIDIYIDTINSTGDLNIYINGVSYGYPVSSNPQINYQLCISDKSEGTYQLDFRLDDDQNYTEYETSKTIHVIKRDLSINLEDIGESIYVDKPVTLKAKLSNTVKGNVIFTINGANYTEYVDNADFVTHEYIPVNNDVLTVVATFEGNDMYNANVSNSRDFIVNRINTTVDVEFSQSIIAGDDVLISVSMNPRITGVVTLIVDTKPYNVAVSEEEGIGYCYVTNLADGVYDVHAEFAGDDIYANSTSDVKQLFVNKVITGMEISIDKNSMSYHDFAVVSIDLNQSINAVVTVKVNGSNHTVGLVNGKGSFTLYDLDKGYYIINAVFAGDDKYKGCISDPLYLTVTGDNISSPVSISLNKYSIFVGDEVIVAVNMNPTVKGTVRLNIGSKSYDVVVNRGVGTFAISDLEMGTYDVQAIFDGDNKHLGNSSDVKQLEVNRIPTSLAVSIDNPSIIVGDKAIFAVNTNPAVTGIVRLNIGSDSYDVVVNGGVGTFAISDLEMGTYDVQAIFDGDNKHLGNSSDVKQLEVNRIPTSLAVSIDNPSIIVGDKAIFAVNTNPAVTGIVRLNIGSDSYDVVVNGGVGTFAISDLEMGTYDVQAIFDGDNKHLGNSSDVKQLEVNRIPTGLAVSIDNPSIFVGDSVVVGVVLNQTINNVVIVNVNDKDYLIGIVNGKGNLTLSGLTFGTYTVNATFAGEGKYAKSGSNNVSLEVNRIKTQLTADSITVTYNGNSDLLITLKDNNGNAVRNANVIVNINGAKTLTTDSNGQVKLSTNGLAPNIYAAKITFDGNAVYDISSKEVKVTVKKATPALTAKAKTFKAKVKTKKYTIALRDNAGKAIKNAKVTLKVKGKTFKATVSSNGKATFKITNLKKKGNYNAVITYGGNNLYNKVTKNVKIKVS